MRFAVAALPIVLYAIACTGDDPAFVADDGSDGGTEAGPGSDGGEAKSPHLTLEGQPLVLTAGTTEVLQFKVTAAENVGDVTFKVSGVPEGVSAQKIVTLAAGAQSLNIQLASTAATKHGDYTVTVEAEGMALTATAPLVVRGTPGIADTGFGIEGSILVPSSAGTLRVIGLANGSIVVGTTVASKPAFILVDPTGNPNLTKQWSASVGTAIVDLVPTDDGGFAALVSATNQLRLVWFSSTGVEHEANILVSTVTTPAAKIAATPKGTLFAQAKTNAAVTVGRYGIGAVDDTFAATSVPSAEGSARVTFLGGKGDGSVWLGMQVGVSQEQIVHVDAAGTTQKTKLYLAFEGCAPGGVLADDFVVRCAADGPLYTIRRFTLGASGNVELASGFGTGGTVSYTSATVKSIDASSGDKIFISTTIDSSTLRTTAYQGDGTGRSVFGTGGRIDVVGDDLPVASLDARGRPIYATHLMTGASHVKISRFWD